MQPKKYFLTAFLLVFILLLNSCDQGKNQYQKQSGPDYNPEISAFTSGLISNQSTIRVRLSSEPEGEQDLNLAIDKKILSIEPGVEGTTYWVDTRTLEFRPRNPLPSGENFVASLDLSSLLKNKDAKKFSFSFSTLPLHLDIHFTGMKAYSAMDLKWNRIEGSIKISDMVNPADLENIIQATQGERILKLSWDHESETFHSFSIDSVERKNIQGRVEIRWDGKPAGLKLQGSREFPVPSLGDFTLMDHQIIQQPDQYISLLFSDPIKSTQNLKGLIWLENNTSLRFTMEDNEIRVYPNVRQQGKIILTIEPGILNILGYKFEKSHTLSLNFEEIKPAVRLIGNGVIVPDAGEILFPFEAVNLKAVDVKVIKIFEDNIAQFLQVNDLSGNNELKRAGRLILKKTVDLIPERPINFNEWNAFSLDLSELVERDPGALYRVELSFRKKHSLYSCGESEPDDLLEDTEDDFETIDEEEIAYWDARYGIYDYDYDYRYFNWNEKDDPCSESYYNYYDRKVSRNIIASNIGIIAKRGRDRNMIFALTDLRTTEPLQGIKLDIYNFQNQLIASLTTGKEGIARIKLEDEPYLAIASKDNEKAYLRIDQGSSLSLSQFDISGAQTQEGIKGFIYGERGVWRPGDSLYITFILEDKENKIPEDHPVIFELTDPRGKMRRKVSLNNGVNGFYPFHSITSPDDPTGMWSLKVEVGGAAFYKSLRVETVKPNRLKIELDPGAEMIYSDPENLELQLNAKWLHGAAAGGLKARVEVNFNSLPTTFPSFKDYHFTDASRTFTYNEKQIFDGTLDPKGSVVIKPNFNLRGKAPGFLTAIFTTRVFEPGGDFSIDQIPVPYSPYPVYCGLRVPEGDRYGMLQTDTLHNFELVTLKETGEPVARKGLEIIIYKLNWRWWWHSANENLASYTGSSSQKPVFTTTLNTDASGKAAFEFKIDYPDWGRFLVIVKDPKGGHSSSQTVYFDWPGWSGRASRKDPSTASILPFSADKSSYNVGETAKVTIPTSSEGRIFLSIENGTGVMDHYWLKTAEAETEFSFTITPEMAPNIYVNVSHLQPHSQSKNDLPVRMYGVIPIRVEDPETHLNPLIEMEETLRPEATTKIRIKERDGKKMTYTLALVDEGLLDLTRFSTPDPWENFYAREALGVSTFDLFDLVLGAHGGRIDGVFSIGGAMAARQVMEPQKRANRFPPMVRFEGPFVLEKGKTNEHKIRIPNYIGSVRVMIVSGYEGAYGKTEKAVPVKKPLMVLSTLPRVLSPGEQLSLPVTVFAMEEKIKDVSISVTTNDLFELSERNKQMHFDKPGDQIEFFSLRVKENIGRGKVQVNVRSGSEEASHEIEIEIRSPNPEVTEYTYAALEKGENWNTTLTLPGMKGTNSVSLEVFSIPPFDFGRRLKYLLQYPHGCAEQVTSAAFPQLYLESGMEISQNLQKVTESNVEAAINKLGSFRLPTGAFTYWPGATASNEWGTSYTGHFLLEAITKGYDVPKEWIDSWTQYQRKTARQWTGKIYESEWHRRSLYLSQAYRLFTLALAGEPQMGAMNRLRERQDVPNIANWFLIAAYALSGHEEIARELMSSVNMKVTDYNTNSLYTFGSSLRDRAVILHTLSLLGEDDKAIPVLQNISEGLRNDTWHSTQTTAWSLIAISKFLGETQSQEGLSIDYRWDSQQVEHAATKHPLASITRDMGIKDQTSLNITNKGEGTVYVRMGASGIPLAGEERASSSNLLMSVGYQSPEGNKIEISEMEQGTDFIAIVSIRNPGTLGDYENLALSQIFPSGWEIRNMRLFEGKPGEFDEPEYQDIRDDRIYSYFNLPAGKVRTFAVQLTATYEGSFYLPGVSCEAMYRKDIAAVVPGKWINVTKPGK
jgi:uncharacterized protein YfaS (alpha-2-macroglobulin family)